MSLMKSEQAIQAVQAIVAAAKPVAAIEVDPEARSGDAINVVAVANQETSVVVDARNTPQLGPFLQQCGLLGGYRAKELHRLLDRQFNQGPNRWACVQLVEQLIAGGRDYSLDLPAIAQRYNNQPLPPMSEGLEAMGAHTCGLAKVIAHQVDAIRQDELVAVSRVEAAAVPAIAQMEEVGMAIDAQRWRQLTHEADAGRAKIRQQLGEFLSEHAGKDLFGNTQVNLESSDEVKRALHALGHRVPNTKRDTLKQLPAPLGPWLLKYRELSKLVSSYGESFLSSLGSDGRLHPTFEQIGASTGRMACHSPNVQAVVKDSEHRQCFRTEPGRTLIIGDYATCELRILAQMSRDPVFLEAFARGEDLHARVASSLFGKPVSKTQNSDLRHRAKAVNFGLVYGMGAGGLAHALNLRTDQARRLLDQYFKTFPKIRAFLESSARESIARGFARTLAGRRLYLNPGSDDASRSQAERIAKNMPIQGTSADITKAALGRIWVRLAKLDGAHLVNTVHDEVVIECAVDDQQEVADILTHEMKAAAEPFLPDVPMEVDAEVSMVWAK